MAVWADTYEAIAKSFNTWSSASPDGGDYISDVALEYANRAQSSLLIDCANGWDLLSKRAALVLTGLSAPLPTDLMRILTIFVDTDGDGKPDYYYFKDGQTDEGFRISWGFTKDTGSVKTVTFFQAPNGPVYVDYVPVLEDFEGTGTEYSFFSHNLMLLKMQSLMAMDKGDIAEGNKLDAKAAIELKTFKAQFQNMAVNMSPGVNDAFGIPIAFPTHDLCRGFGVLPGVRLDRRDRY